jgi:hypothetical protein
MPLSNTHVSSAYVYLSASTSSKQTVSNWNAELKEVAETGPMCMPRHKRTTPDAAINKSTRERLQIKDQSFVWTWTDASILQAADYGQSIGFEYLKRKKNKRGFNLFNITSLGLVINLGQPLFPQKGINFIRSP